MSCDAGFVAAGRQSESVDVALNPRMRALSREGENHEDADAMHG